MLRHEIRHNYMQQIHSLQTWWKYRHHRLPYNEDLQHLEVKVTRSTLLFVFFRLITQEWKVAESSSVVRMTYSHVMCNKRCDLRVNRSKVKITGLRAQAKCTITDESTATESLKSVYGNLALTKCIKSGTYTL